MKRFTFILFIVFIVTGMTYAGVNITAPSGGTWYKGSAYNITWDYPGCDNTIVKINVFRNSIDVANFVEQLTGPNSGTYRWTIPMSYTNGTYYIRIKTDPAQTGCQGDSRAFTITDDPGAERGSINVTSPTTGTRWSKGGTAKTITWNKSGSLDSNVKINIFRGSIDTSNFVEQLTGPNTGSKSWVIPGTYTVGTYYLRVKEANGTIQGDSNAFEIVNQMYVLTPVVATLFKPHSIKVMEPNGGRTYAQNSTLRILWTPKNLTNNIKITLFKGRHLMGTIAENIAPGRISYEWTIGRTLIKTVSPGTGYKIKIEETGKNIMDFSDNPFTIEEPKKIDLSCYISGHSSRDDGRIVRLNVKVRVNNFGGPPIARVPVQVTLRTQGDSLASGAVATNYLENVTYRGHSFEYSLSFDFRLHSSETDGSRLRKLDRVATVVVDPGDTLRDRRLMNNTSTYTFLF
ncbi:MAG: Ser-Thr-rich GPI-anchored membrane family protein [Acidobacteriota bacterium]